MSVEYVGEKREAVTKAWLSARNGMLDKFDGMDGVKLESDDDSATGFWLKYGGALWPPSVSIYRKTGRWSKKYVGLARAAKTGKIELEFSEVEEKDWFLELGKNLSSKGAVVKVGLCNDFAHTVPWIDSEDEASEEEDAKCEYCGRRFGKGKNCRNCGAPK